MTVNAATLAQIIHAAGINPRDLPEEWQVSKRVAEQWLTSKQPPFKAEDYGTLHLEDMVRHVRTLLSTITDAGNSVILLRSFEPDDLITDLGDKPRTGLQYNRAIQHLLLMEAMDTFDATLVVIPDAKWPDNNEHIMVLRPDTPVFAVAHRLPDEARIDLCVPTSDPTSPGVQSAEDLIALDTLHPELPLPADQLGDTGLWKPRSIGEFLATSSVHALGDWRISGAGHPVAITSILPNDLEPYFQNQQPRFEV